MSEYWLIALLSLVVLFQALTFGSMLLCHKKQMNEMQGMLNELADEIDFIDEAFDVKDTK